MIDFAHKRIFHFAAKAIAVLQSLSNKERREYENRVESNLGYKVKLLRLLTVGEDEDE